MISGIRRRKIELFNSLDCSGLIRKLDTGEYRLYYKKKLGKVIIRKSIGTYSSLKIARSHERYLS